MGVFHINNKRGIIDLSSRAGTKVNGPRNRDICYEKLRGYFKVNSS